MAPKRPRDPHSILLDCDPVPLCFDKHKHPTAAIAYHEGEARSFVFKREWTHRDDSSKPQKNNWFVMDGFIDNPGFTSWTVNEVNDKNVTSILEGTGEDKLFPYVYIIQQPYPLPLPLFKIGCSFDPEKRRNALQTGNPFEIHVYKTYKASDRKGDFVAMYELERALHREFRDLGGPFATHDVRDGLPSGMACGREWFYCETSDISHIDDRVQRFLKANKHVYPSPDDASASFAAAPHLYPGGYDPGPASNTSTARAGESDSD
jgi:hypothetical protein